MFLKLIHKSKLFLHINFEKLSNIFLPSYRFLTSKEPLIHKPVSDFNKWRSIFVMGFYIKHVFIPKGLSYCSKSASNLWLHHHKSFHQLPSHHCQRPFLLQFVISIFVKIHFIHYNSEIIKPLYYYSDHNSIYSYLSLFVKL